MKKLIICLGLFLCTFSEMAFSQEENENNPSETQIEVVVGIDKVIRLDFNPSAKVQIGNESVLTYELIPVKKEITFKGVKPGRTSVILRNNIGDIKARYFVTITANDLSKIVQELREYLGGIEGIKIGIKGNKVFVGGQIIVPEDIGKVVIILDKYPDVLRLVELSPMTQQVIARKMQSEIQKSQMRDVTVRIINKIFVLEGVVSSKAQKDEAFKLASLYIPDRIESLARRTDSVQKVNKPILESLIKVNEKSSPQPIPKLIKVAAQFVELTKDYNKIFGFKWQPLLSDGQGSIRIGKTAAGDTATKSSDALSGRISNLLPKLSSAKAAGYARVIQSGVIIVENKTLANINKKESKPFAVGTGEFTKAERAEAGFDLNVKPVILQNEKISLDLGMTVSATIGDPPETLSNTIKTKVVVKSRESAAIGGIVINKTSTDFDRNAPGDKDEFEGASPLFSFVRSKSYTNTKSQFVVFLTPEIIESASEGTEKIKKKFRLRRR